MDVTLGFLEKLMDIFQHREVIVKKKIDNMKKMLAAVLAYTSVLLFVWRRSAEK